MDTIVNDCTDIAHSLPAAKILAACNDILASNIFAKAPRMCRLLHFLVKETISGDSTKLSEHAIGIRVFDRDPSLYSTIEDPIVRVQTGRLREKLRTYYATSGTPSGIEISIPDGSYVPIIRPAEITNPSTTQNHKLAVRPIKCFARHEGSEPFTQGLSEELLHHLFNEFGNIVVDRQDHSSSEHSRQPPIHHLLEGSIRIDSERIRTSVRLINSSQGNVAWSWQSDRSLFFAIRQQEELASTICRELKRYLCHT